MEKPSKILLILAVVFRITLVFTTPVTPDQNLETGKTNYTQNTDCPTNQAYHNETQRCYTLNSRGPCDELMSFLSASRKSKFGYCDCDPVDLDNNNCTYRPKIFWQRENRCYYAFEQGPCARNEWLMLEKTKLYYNPFCTRNPCLPNQNDNLTNIENKFWFPFGGVCYQTGTQGFCRESKYKVYIMRNELNPLCLVDKICEENMTETTTEPPDDESGECKARRKLLGNCRKKQSSNIHL